MGDVQGSRPSQSPERFVYSGKETLAGKSVPKLTDEEKKIVEIAKKASPTLGERLDTVELSEPSLSKYLTKLLRFITSIWSPKMEAASIRAQQALNAITTYETTTMDGDRGPKNVSMQEAFTFANCLTELKEVTKEDIREKRALMIKVDSSKNFTAEQKQAYLNNFLQQIAALELFCKELDGFKFVSSGPCPNIPDLNMATLQSANNFFNALRGASNFLSLPQVEGSKKREEYLSGFWDRRTKSQFQAKIDRCKKIYQKRFYSTFSCDINGKNETFVAAQTDNGFVIQKKDDYDRSELTGLYFGDQGEFICDKYSQDHAKKILKEFQEMNEQKTETKDPRTFQSAGSELSTQLLDDPSKKERLKKVLFIMEEKNVSDLEVNVDLGALVSLTGFKITSSNGGFPMTIKAKCRWSEPVNAITINKDNNGDLSFSLIHEKVDSNQQSGAREDLQKIYLDILPSLIVKAYPDLAFPSDIDLKLISKKYMKELLSEKLERESEISIKKGGVMFTVKKEGYEFRITKTEGEKQEEFFSSDEKVADPYLYLALKEGNVE